MQSKLLGTPHYRSMTRVCRVSGGQLRVSSSRSLCSVSVNPSQLRDTRRYEEYCRSDGGWNWGQTIDRMA